ncbi:MAG TPA: YciI-like protein [Candidatus Acidoferrales bacterium]
MTYFALFYEVVDDYLERRGQYRPQHLQLAKDAQDRGELVLAGALADPADRALLVFRGADKSVAENFARQDPYVVNGLVKRWEVRPWTVVVGAGADPVK